MKVSVGEEVTLHCPLLDRASGTLSWYRKLPGQGPELVLSTGSGLGLKFGSGLGPGRVRATADGALVLPAARRSDSGFYFCCVSREQEKKNGPGDDVTTLL